MESMENNDQLSSSFPGQSKSHTSSRSSSGSNAFGINDHHGITAEMESMGGNVQGNTGVVVGGGKGVSELELKKQLRGRTILLACDETSMSAAYWLLNHLIPGDSINLLHVLEKQDEEIVDESGKDLFIPNVDKYFFQNGVNGMLFNDQNYLQNISCFKGMHDLCDIFVSKGIHFQGLISRPIQKMNLKHHHIDDTSEAILDLIKKDIPDLVVVGSSKRTARYVQ
jgi:hypothetical protein